MVPNCFFAKFDANERRQVLFEVLKKWLAKAIPKISASFCSGKVVPEGEYEKKYDDLKFGSAENGIVFGIGDLPIAIFTNGFLILISI